MPVAELLAALEREAAAQAEQLRADARERATAVVARAAAEADRRRALALDHLGREGRVKVARETVAVERALRERVLVARAEAIQRVLDAAEGRLAGAGIDAWRSAAPALVAGTLAYLEDRHAILRCPADALAVVSEAARATGVKVEADPGQVPGVLGLSEDGRVVVDNTLRGRLERMRGDLATGIARQLEPEGTCAGTT